MSADPGVRWSARDWLILLARWPAPGVGKSRLAADLSRVDADQLQRAFLLDTLGWASWAPHFLVSLTPPAAAKNFRRYAPRARLAVQPDGDLGCRIHHAFLEAFALGARRAVIIGSDSPNLPPGIVQACVDGLTYADAAIAPTLDGGFCALGLKQPVAALFTGVRWSTPLVLQQIRRNAHSLGLVMRTTATWYDVDDLPGLRRLQTDLRLDGQFTPHTTAILSRMSVQERRKPCL